MAFAASKLATSTGPNVAKTFLRQTINQPKTDYIIKYPEPSELTLKEYAFYYDTSPPSGQQLWHAESFFKSSKHSPIQMWTASEFRTIPMSNVPEVVFLGRSNVGKSSLLNALMDQDVCYTSSKIGRTHTINAYGVGGRKAGEAQVVLVDTPGYGKGSHEEWGKEIIKYLTKRKQLRRTFVLIDSHHGLKPGDRDILSLLRSTAIPHQVILSKADSVLVKGNSKRVPRGITDAKIQKLASLAERTLHKVQPDRDVGKGGVELGVPALGEIIACSARVTNEYESYLGINAIRWAVLRAVGLEENNMFRYMGERRGRTGVERRQSG
ncbi:ribosome biogenesis GTP-binding protein YsxC [Paracoccidioides brasiliensis Pb18]|uniref:GTP-binding protein 8 n=1 Tax=Paracoccidioides brasiliensis (strain Pb18) TaxID=502780 RepID=C1GB45_PARBD|nr:ribosome biogenesis GTP-binding protein YsxC [Paracoccidioides brasiliensis Pb18]EEH48767.1 ribosome biogenesis GTP-binding protein YsxC [Paracoccidioides brasiliensis Pb18]